MNIRITKAKYESFWYSEHVGEVFEVRNEMNVMTDDENNITTTVFTVMNDPNNDSIDTVRHIDIDDCEILVQRSILG